MTSPPAAKKPAAPRKRKEPGEAAPPAAKKPRGPTKKTVAAPAETPASPPPPEIPAPTPEIPAATPAIPANPLTQLLRPANAATSAAERKAQAAAAKLEQAKREAARAEILRQRAAATSQSALQMKAGGTTIVEDRSRWLNRAPPRAAAPLIETRVFCVAEAQRFGEERLVKIRKVCKDDVFFQGYPKGKWPESSPFA